MSTLLDEFLHRETTSPAERLQTTMAAVRVSLKWFGTRKTLTPAQKSEAADAFGAEGTFLSAGKKLIDTAHPAFKSVTADDDELVGDQCDSDPCDAATGETQTQAEPLAVGG